jgi:membrane complex biogenesis BtpA family protein
VERKDTEVFLSKESWISDLFGVEKPIIGMVHLRPLPGSPFYHAGDMDRIIATAVQEAKILEEAGVDGLQVENMWDHPYLKENQIGHETTASLAVCSFAVMEAVQIPVGINCHLNGSIQSLAAAVASGARWIRVFEMANAYISNAGIIEASGPAALRYRHAIEADQVKILGDVLVKHGSHFITSDRSIGEQAHDVELFKADAVIVTGGATGENPKIDDIQAVRSAVSIPVFVGSGLTEDNIGDYYSVIDGAIIGSQFKEDGVWQNPVSRERTRLFTDRVKGLRRSVKK